uniref:Uncharacterized protein n=1 Tax=Rhinella marina erythrocytic-like virus TaxID=2859906 RepID=A0A8F6UAD1_9VIRU|nr:hypothetical protein RMELV052 [Rhinella marina erythrocytic-like virus]
MDIIGPSKQRHGSKYVPKRQMFLSKRILDNIINDGSTMYFTPNNITRLYFGLIHPEFIKGLQMAIKFAKKSSRKNYNVDIMAFFPISYKLRKLQTATHIKITESYRFLSKLAKISKIELSLSTKMLTVLAMILETFVKLVRNNVVYKFYLGENTITNSIEYVKKYGLDFSIKNLNLTTIMNEEEDEFEHNLATAGLTCPASVMSISSDEDSPS